jgi:hypothetical protein
MLHRMLKPKPRLQPFLPEDSARKSNAYQKGNACFLRLHGDRPKRLDQTHIMMIQSNHFCAFALEVAFQGVIYARMPEIARDELVSAIGAGPQRLPFGGHVLILAE